MERLAELIAKVLITEGAQGKKRLAGAIGRSERMIDRYRLGECLPSSDKAYYLALACGCSKAEAYRLANDRLGMKVAQTA